MKIALVFLLGIVFGIWAAYFSGARGRQRVSLQTYKISRTRDRQNGGQPPLPLKENLEFDHLSLPCYYNNVVN